MPLLLTLVSPDWGEAQALLTPARVQQAAALAVHRRRPSHTIHTWELAMSVSTHPPAHNT
jgi:hypothetical protein